VVSAAACRWATRSRRQSQRRHNAEEMVEHIEGLYGRASRIWVMDRGMAGEDNVEFLREGGRRYIVGTAKNSLRKFERELRARTGGWCMQGWKCGSQRRRAPGGFHPVRSAERRAKEQAMHERFEKRIEEGLGKIQTSCLKKKQKAGDDRHTRGPVAGAEHASSSAVRGEGGSGMPAASPATVVEGGSLERVGALERGLLRAAQQRDGLESEDLWRAYIKFTEAEAAFHPHRPGIRPVRQFRKKIECRPTSWLLFAYVLWRLLGEFARGGTGRRTAASGSKPLKQAQKSCEATSTAEVR